MNKRTIIQATLTVVALCIMTGISIGYAAPSRPNPGSERHGERRGWKYKAVIDKAAGRINASVEYVADTAQQGQGIMATQQQLAQELITSGISSLETTVVFRHPLSQAAFEQFVVNAGLNDISGYTMRYLDNQGQRVTINGAPVNGILVPQDLLNIALKDLQERAPGKLLGWVQVQATVTPKNYNAIMNDKNVYLVDVSRSAIRAALSDDASAAKMPVDVISPQLYWKLEDMQLVSD